MRACGMSKAVSTLEEMKINEYIVVYNTVRGGRNK